MTDTATEKQGLPPINLHANSYNLQDLEAASKRAEELKTDKGTMEALAEIPNKLAANQGVLESQLGIAVPEHHKLAEITDAQGNTVMAPVLMSGKEAEAAAEDAAEAEKLADAQTENTSRRRGQADATDVTTDKASS